MMHLPFRGAHPSVCNNSFLASTKASSLSNGNMKLGQSIIASWISKFALGRRRPMAYNSFASIPKCFASHPLGPTFS